MGAREGNDGRPKPTSQLIWGVVAAVAAFIGVLAMGGAIGFAILSAIFAGVVTVVVEDRLLNLGERSPRNRRVDL